MVGKCAGMGHNFHAIIEAAVMLAVDLRHIILQFLGQFFRVLAFVYFQLHAHIQRCAVGEILLRVVEVGVWLVRIVSLTI